MGGASGASGQFGEVRGFLGGLDGPHLHAKRVDALAGATLGVMTGASLAVAVIGQALARAQARGLVTEHPHSLAFALAFSAALAQFAALPLPGLAAALELQAVAATHEFPYWAAWGVIHEGWARARLGDAARGEALLRQGLADYVATEAGLLRPYGLALLAAVVAPRDPAEAGALLAEALGEAGGIRFHLPMLAGVRVMIGG